MLCRVEGPGCRYSAANVHSEALPTKLLQPKPSPEQSNPPAKTQPQTKQPTSQNPPSTIGQLQQNVFQPCLLTLLHRRHLGQKQLSSGYGITQSIMCCMVRQVIKLS